MIKFCRISNNKIHNINNLKKIKNYNTIFNKKYQIQIIKMNLILMKIHKMLIILILEECLIYQIN